MQLAQSATFPTSRHAIAYDFAITPEARVVVSTWGAGFAHTAAGALAERAVRRVVAPALALRDGRVRCIMRLADGRRAHGLRHEDGNDECDLQSTMHFARHGRGQFAMASWN